jgi:hypothetical protein
MASESEAEPERLEQELRLAPVERDPDDSKDVIIEIRRGVGGDEAALWAGASSAVEVGLPQLFERIFEIPHGSLRGDRVHSLLSVFSHTVLAR